MRKLEPIHALGAATWCVCVLTFAAPVAAQDATPESLVGKPAPDVNLSTIDGKTVSLAQERGHVVVMDFWATWCIPCKLALPNLQALSEDAALRERGLRIWAVNTTAWKPETEEKARNHIATKKYKLTVPMDVKNVVKQACLLDALPRTVIVGRDGTVKKVLHGFDLEKPDESKKELRDAIEEALKE